MPDSPKIDHERKPLRGRRVLIVADEYYLADDMERGLQSLGAEIAGPVGFLQDKSELLEQIGVLDGAVLDVNIRSEMIFPLARELQRRDVPFVFTTGYDKALFGLEFSTTPLCEKPIDIAAMQRYWLSWFRAGRDRSRTLYVE